MGKTYTVLMAELSPERRHRELARDGDRLLVPDSPLNRCSAEEFECGLPDSILLVR